jgi:hypothetical protein
MSRRDHDTLSPAPEDIVSAAMPGEFPTFPQQSGCDLVPVRFQARGLIVRL